MSGIGTSWSFWSKPERGYSLMMCIRYIDTETNQLTGIVEVHSPISDHKNLVLHEDYCINHGLWECRQKYGWSHKWDIECILIKQWITYVEYPCAHKKE